MDQLMPHIRITVNEKLYLKDPETSKLGKNLLVRSIEMIDEIGLEKFTFRKLALELDTTESSIYRYFENKQKLLLYLSSWYWIWLETILVFRTANLTCGEDKLRVMIQILSQQEVKMSSGQLLDLNLLRNIVIAESSKAYLTKEVDAANKEGLFGGFKQLCSRFSDVFLEINPTYPFPNMLSSTVVEGIFHQQFLADHLPSLSNGQLGADYLKDFFLELSLSALKNKH